MSFPGFEPIESSPITTRPEHPPNKMKDLKPLPKGGSTAEPWSSFLGEGDEHPDRPNGQTCEEWVC